MNYKLMIIFRPGHLQEGKYYAASLSGIIGEDPTKKHNLHFFSYKSLKMLQSAKIETYKRQ